MLSKRGTVARIYLPPDANCLLSVADHCLRSRNYVNLIVIDKQPQLQWLDMDAAIEHCAARRVDLAVGQQRRGRRAGRRAGLRRRHPDAGDGRGGLVAAQARSRAEGARGERRRPDGAVPARVATRTAWTRRSSSSSSPRDKPVVFAFHGYQRAIHEIVHGRRNAERFHVRGFNEQGTTTTPFDMVVLNEMSRYHLCIEALRRSRHARRPAR